MMREKTAADLEARVRWLQALAEGLAKELRLWQGKNSPLQPVERKGYLRAISAALAGADEARVVLERLLQRLARGTP